MLVTLFLALLLRIIFMPTHNLASDPFELSYSAKTLADSFDYVLPAVEIFQESPRIHPVWPSGFPIMLATVIKLFGFSEQTLRLFTILLGVFLVYITIKIAELLFSRNIAIVSGILVAVHPLLVSFNSRIFTNNAAVLFYFIAFYFLLKSLLTNGKELLFCSLEDLYFDKNRLFYLLLFFLTSGYLLTIRDTFVILSIVPLYIIFISKIFYPFHQINKSIFLKTFLFSICSFFIGFSPSLYFNYKLYGHIFTSTHAEYGASLDFRSLLFGGADGLVIPGLIIILFTFLIYCTPVLSMFFHKNKTRPGIFILHCCLLALIPIIVVNGSYFPTFSGASPRYILPLIPFACIYTSVLLQYLLKHSKTRTYNYFMVSLSLWHLYLYYPFPITFRLTPKLAFLGMYAPYYQKYSYYNYPDFSTQMALWVKSNTPSNSIIITPSRLYHFYYYGERDVLNMANLNKIIKNRLISSERPVYFIDDQHSAINSKIHDVEKYFINDEMHFNSVDSLKQFSPHKGIISLQMYLLNNNRINK